MASVLRSSGSARAGAACATRKHKKTAIVRVMGDPRRSVHAFRPRKTQTFLPAPNAEEIAAKVRRRVTVRSEDCFVPSCKSFGLVGYDESVVLLRSFQGQLATIIHGADLLPFWRFMAVFGPRYSKEEFARRGQAIYKRVIRPRLQAADEGKCVAIDIETGAYEIDSDDYSVTELLLAQRPNAQP